MLTSASDFLPLRLFLFPLFRSHLEVKVAEGVSVTEEKFRAKKSTDRTGSVEILQTMRVLRTRRSVLERVRNIYI